MTQDQEHTEAARIYADAYASHYSERDFSVALQAYDQLIELHPGAPEAEYSRTQIRNIVKSVVPAQELLAAQLELVHHHLQLGTDSPAAVSP